jgi:polar amino acid transport system substrate-binding protein
MRKALIGAAALVALALVVVGCGSGSDSTSSSASTTGSTDNGTLTIGVNLALKPWGFVENGQNTGINVEFGEALAERLGMEAEIKPVTIDGMIPGLEANRYDIVLATATDTPEREEQIDFVDYAEGASRVLAATGNAATYKTLADLCGASVGVDRGSVNQIILEDQKCPGGDSVAVQLFGDDNASALALRSGQVDAMASDSALVGLLAKEQPDQFELTEIVYESGLIGATLPKGSPLLPKVAKATQAAMDSGELEEIFTRWGSPEAALTKAKINPES